MLTPSIVHSLSIENTSNLNVDLIKQKAFEWLISEMEFENIQASLIDSDGLEKLPCL